MLLRQQHCAPRAQPKHQRAPPALIQPQRRRRHDLCSGRAGRGAADISDRRRRGRRACVLPPRAAVAAGEWALQLLCMKPGPALLAATQHAAGTCTVPPQPLAKTQQVRCALAPPHSQARCAAEGDVIVKPKKGSAVLFFSHTPRGIYVSACICTVAAARTLRVLRPAPSGSVLQPPQLTRGCGACAASPWDARGQC